MLLLAQEVSFGADEDVCGFLPRVLVDVGPSLCDVRRVEDPRARRPIAGGTMLHLGDQSHHPRTVVGAKRAEGAQGFHRSRVLLL